MGINAAFSSWLQGAQSFATTTLRTAQNYGAALQAQTMTAVSAAQRAAVQPFQQVLQPRSATPTSSPHTTRTLTPVDAVTRAVSSGVGAVQQAAGQIVRAHAPIVQGVQRDFGRAVQMAPAAARSAPAAAQQAARQISAAHAPIVRGVQRDVARAAQAAPAAARSAPAAVQQAARQISAAHAPIVQGVQRDVGRAVQGAPAAVRSAPAAAQRGIQQIARAHSPIMQGIQRDAGRAAQAIPAPVRDAAAYANQSKRNAQAELTRTAGPAAPFEKGWTHPVYEWGREANKAYQGFVDQVYPLWSRTQPLHAVPEIRQFQRGLARAPGSLLEGLTFIPPAAERAGQLLWKEPHKLAGTAAKFAGQQIEGMGAAYERDPWDFTGEMIGTAALSYGIGAAARPGAVARGSGATAPARTVAGSTRSPGGTGSRFRALEFGYQTKLVQKQSPTSQKPFRLAEWQAERQKYARGRAAVQVQETPMRTQASTQPRADPGKGGASRQTSPPPESSRSRAVYGGVPPLLTGHMPAQVTPAGHVVLPTTMPPGAPQRGGRGPQSDQVGRNTGLSSTSMARDLASIETEVLAMITPPPSILAQPLATSMIIQPRTETKAQTSPPMKGPGVLAAPPHLLQPRTTARGKDRKKKEEEDRRRRKRKGEADHWEIGPAPGTTEMAAMIFGAPGGRSVLNLGGSPLSFGQPSFGFAARAPARPPVIPGAPRPPTKKPAHAGERRKVNGKGKGAKKKK